MLAIHADILALDFETTGAVKNLENLPWQIGAIRILQNEIRRDQAFSLFLQVPQTHVFNTYAPGRWASMRDKLAQSPTFLELWPSIHPWLTGRYLLAHHAPTERGILNKFFPLHSFPHWLDSLNIARYALPKRKSYKLEDLIPQLDLGDRVLTLAPDLQPHDAYYDACACAVLLQYILGLPGWGNATVEDLQEL